MLPSLHLNLFSNNIFSICIVFYYFIVLQKPIQQLGENSKILQYTSFNPNEICFNLIITVVN